MILRRVTEHVREQNWFAVGIDFVIVVVGVYMGIEVANWNDARRDRVAEAAYLDRLDREIAEITPEVEASRETVRKRMQRMIEVRDFFKTGEGAAALGAEHCAALGTSHIFAATIFYPPTIKEMIATGRIILIRDAVIRTAILSLDQTNAESSQLRTDIQIDRLPLGRAYPDLINLGLSSWADSLCDFAAMRHNQSFLNDFIDNMQRSEAYASRVTGRQSEVLAALGIAVSSGSTKRTLQASSKAEQARPAEQHVGN